MQHTTASVLLVDDHALMLDALELQLYALEKTLRVCKATSMLQALSLCEQQTFRLAIIDLHMPNMSGLDGLRRLHDKQPGLPVVIISADESPEAIRATMNAGAAGFITKSMPRNAVQEALRRILDGERFVPVSDARDAAREADDNLHLTARERDVLARLVAGHSNKEIARAIAVEPSTVALHLTHIYRKLGVSSRSQAIRRSFDLGLGDLQLDGAH